MSSSLTTSDSYRKSLEEIDIGYNISLHEVMKLMPEYKLNLKNKINTNEKVTASYLKNENRLKKRINDLKSLKNMIENDSNTLEQDIKKMNTIIRLEENKNAALKENYNQIISSNSAAKGMLFDTQLLYNQQYIGNLLLTAVILIYGKTIYSKYY